MRGFFNKKIEVGSFTAIIVLGACSGLMISSFVAGYLSGNAAGFERARSESIKTLSRFPIAGAGDNEISDAEREEIYAKLDKPEIEQDENLDLANAANGIVDNVIEKVDQQLKEKDKPGSSLLNTLLNKEESKEDQEPKDPQEQAKEDLKDELEGKSIGDILAENKKKILEEQKTVQAEAAKQVVETKLESKIEQVNEEPAVTPAEPDKKAVFDDLSAGLTKPKSYISKAVPSGWYAQIMAPQNISEANAMAEKLHNSGFPVVIEQALVNQSTYFRVLVGAEKNREQALRLVEQLRREPYITSDPFVRRMGS